MVPKNSEPSDALKARFPEAMKDVYNQMDVAEGRLTCPSSIPKHVFDFMDGTRLIVSRETLPDKRELIHVSSSNPALSRADLEMRTKSHYSLLSGKTANLVLLLITRGRVLHFYVNERVM